MCPTYPSLLHTHTSRSLPPPWLLFDLPACEVASGSVSAAQENWPHIHHHHHHHLIRTTEYITRKTISRYNEQNAKARVALTSALDI